MLMNYGYGIKVDASGKIYLAGLTVSTNFPTSVSAYHIIK